MSDFWDQERLLGGVARDRFVIERRLGEGSMGAVYLAFDRERKAKVALKTLRRVDALGIYRFKREFRALADLNHPNLVTLHELFSEGDQWFFTMEYIEGKDFLEYVLGAAHDTLRRSRSSSGRGSSGRGSSGHGGGIHTDSWPLYESVVRTGEEGGGKRDTGGERVHGLEMLFPTPLRDPERLREVMAQITEGLHAVHSAGRLHRDLKPDNVLCTREGRAVLLDFGIVSDEPREVHRTLEPGVLGTPAYMSPEQAAGDPVDASSDFYALGSMMYEALTGAIPFDGNYTDVLLHKQERDPPPPSHLVSGVPADLESLCMSLLHRDPTQRPHADAVLRALRSRKIVSLPPAPTAAERDSGPLFVGRARELDALRSALSTTNSGKPVVTLLSGPSGIGKTTLVERFIHEIVSHDDGIVLKGRCYERESVPFKAIDSLVDSLSRYLRQLSPVHVAEVMPRDVLALAQLFPVLHRVEDVSQIKRRAPLPADPKELRRRAFAALSELFSRIADRSPLFLFIDDMQWGDVDSAKLLADLVSGSDAPAVLLLCAYRSGEIDSNPCLRTLLGQLRDAAHREVRELTLGALSPEESLTLAQLLLGPTAEAEAAAVGAEANGSPYLLTELVQHVRERGRGGGTQISLESALQERLAALSKDARTLLQLVCVAARPVPEETLALASAFDIDLQSAMVELRAAKLVRGVTLRSHRAVEAYHDRVRDAVISRMPPELLALWHRRLASTLEASGSLDLEALTDHLLGAGESARAGLYALRAAAQAERVLAFDKAARLYAIAVVHHGQTDADKRELLLRWGDALVNAGRSAEAANVYLEMSKLADGKHAEELRRKAGIQLVLGGQIEEGIETLRETLREMGAELPPNFPEALHEVKRLHDELGRRGLRFVTRTGAQQRVDVLARLDALWSLALGLLINELERPLPLVGRYLLDALDAGEPEHVLQGLCLYHAYIDGALRSGSEPARVGALPAAEELARQIDGPRARALLSLAYGADAHRAGAWQQALAQLVPAEDAFRKQGPSGVNEMRMARLIITSLHHTFGACDELQIAERWAREAEEREDSLMASRLRLATSQLLLAQDDPRGASERCDEAMRPWHGADAGLTSFAEWMARVQIELYTENTARCEARSFEQEDFLRSPLATIAVWRARALLSRARAALCASLGTSGTRNVLVERAAADIDRVLALQLPCFTDQLRLLSAAVAQQRGQRTRALELLDAVLISRDAEAQPLVLASALRRRGELSGPDAGELVARGDNLMRERGVVAPERMTRLYAPGFAQHPQ